MDSTVIGVELDSIEEVHDDGDFSINIVSDDSVDQIVEDPESIMTSTSRKRKFSLTSVETFSSPQYKHVIYQETLVIKQQQANRWSKKTKLKDVFASM